MAKPIIVKCCYCGKGIERDTAYKVGERKYYCDETCCNNHEDDKKVKLKKSSTDKYKPKKGTDRRALTDTIQNLYLENGYTKNRIPWNLIMAQVKSMLEEHQSWSYYTIQYILEYMTNVLELNLFNEEYKGSILNLVPYYAIEAEDYWNETQSIEQAIAEFNFAESKTIIKKNQNNGKKRNIKKITFDNI